MLTLFVLLASAVAHCAPDLRLEFTLNEQADGFSLAIHDLMTERKIHQREAKSRAARLANLEPLQSAFPSAQLIELRHQVKMDRFIKAINAKRDAVLRAKLLAVGAVRGGRSAEFAAHDCDANRFQLEWFRLELRKAKKEKVHAAARHERLRELSTYGSAPVQSVLDAERQHHASAISLEGWQRKVTYQEAQLRGSEELRDRVRKRN